MLTKTKTNRKKLKVENFEKKMSGDMMERELPTKFGWINAAVSKKPYFTDGRQTEVCVTTVALLTKSSRAQK